MRSLELELRFPNLRPEDYAITSQPSDEYNCLAWALGFTDDWWWPEPGSQWPAERRDLSLPAFVTLLSAFGYGPCADVNLEPAYEKLAIYATDDGVPTHIARQLASGVWSSKCGKLEDITHALDGLEGPPPAYGRVERILRRPRRDATTRPAGTS